MWKVRSAEWLAARSSPVGRQSGHRIVVHPGGLRGSLLSNVRERGPLLEAALAPGRAVFGRERP